MSRFINAMIGDKVYSRIHGEGFIRNITLSALRPLGIVFNKNSDNQAYCLDGRIHKYSAEPVLFYRDDGNLYLEERPPRPIDGKNVPIDTKVICNNYIHTEKKYPKHFYCMRDDEPLVFVDGLSSHTAEDLEESISHWFNVVLAEDVIVDGICYPKGSKIV